MKWTIHRLASTVSTNADARGGAHGEAWTADFQTGGRGRLGHRWLSPPGTNLMMSAVLSVDGLEPGHVATLPLAAGLATVRAVASFLPSAELGLKWPNDVLVGGRKIAGILCERRGECVVTGIGVNVLQREFDPEIASRATSLAQEGAVEATVGGVLDAVLSALEAVYQVWRKEGFAAVWPQIRALDVLRGREVRVFSADGDDRPVQGVSGGILPDGALDVGGRAVYAGEAHIGSEFFT